MSKNVLRIRLLFTVSCVLAFCITKLQAQVTGYSYGKEITILGSQVSGSLSNFPVLISFTDPDLRTVGSGGNVENANGWDIIFSSGCTTTLPHQIERYTPSTGEYVAWVQVLALTAGNNTSIYSSGTVSLWGYVNSFPASNGVHQYFFGHTTPPYDSYSNRIQIYTDDTGGNLDIGLGASHRVTPPGGIQTLATQQWYYITLTWDNGDFEAYVNGLLRASSTYSGLSALNTQADIGNQGRPVNARHEAQNGTIDEVRVSNSVRSADWIATEYRNQNDPSSFYSVSNELTADATCALPVELALFEAIAKDGKVKLIWTTTSEYNNGYFTIERSNNDLDWEEISEVEGAGNSHDRIGYLEWDDNPYPGVSYYRLRQTDYDGTSTYSWVRRVDVGSISVFKVYPNPAKTEFVIEMDQPETAKIILFNSLGQPVETNKTILGTSMIVETSQLHKGLYHLQVHSGEMIKRVVIILE